MEEFKDAEEELPLDEFSESTSVPLQDSLPSNPHSSTSPNIKGEVEDAPFLNQKISETLVLDNIALVQEKRVSSVIINEQGRLNGNSTVSLSELHNTLPPCPIRELDKDISCPDLSASISVNSTNLSSESTAVSHSLPAPTSPTVQDISRERDSAVVTSTAFSSEVRDIPLCHPSLKTLASDENPNPNVSGTASGYCSVMSREVHCSSASHSSSEVTSLTLPEISKEAGTASDNSKNQLSEANSFPESHSMVHATIFVSPGTSNEANTVAEDSVSLSSEVRYVPQHYEAGGGSSVGLNEIRSKVVNTVVGETKRAEDSKGFGLNNHQRVVGNFQNESRKLDDSSGRAKPPTVPRGLVDTTAPFESVKEAVTRFGGIVDWKAHRRLASERRKQLQLELEKVQQEIPNYKNQAETAEDAKAQVLEELNRTKRLVEELKLNLEKAQTEEAEAKQDSDLAELRAREIEEGIADEASVAAKAQLEVARERHEAAIVELKSVKKQLEELQKDYVSLLEERDAAIEKAEEAALVSKEIEKTVEDLTLELIAAKEYLESAHAAHLEAEEHRIGAALARDQDYLNWEKELKQAEEEIKKLNEKLLSAKDLKEKLETANALLLSLNSELVMYMQSKLNQESGSVNGEENELQKVQKELEEVKATIERTKNEIDILKVVESSLKAELEKEKAGLANMRQREGMASIAVSSVEAEIERTKEEIKVALTKEKEYREKMVELPKLLQQAAQEAENAKSDAQSARDELRKTKEDAEQVKAATSTAETRLRAALKEIEAAKASERLALLAIKALQESEGEELSGGVTLPLEEYYGLSKRAHEVEVLSNERVTAAVAQIDVAKESERKTLERLEAAHREINEKKEALGVALEKAEKAKEGKLGVEQELRKWRADHEQKRRASAAAQSGIPPKSPARSFESQQKSFANADTVHPGPNSKIYTVENKEENNIPESKVRKKKKSFFPRIVLFLARKKAQTL